MSCHSWWIERAIRELHRQGVRVITRRMLGITPRSLSYQVANLGLVRIGKAPGPCGRRLYQFQLPDQLPDPGRMSGAALNSKLKRFGIPADPITKG